MYEMIERCRICGNPELMCVLDLGVQMLTGVFPRTRDQSISSGPLRLMKCMGGPDVCGLLQLGHSFDLGEMYGENYGYRSGLNESMVRHLRAKVAKISTCYPLSAGDLVVDIGSNDGTTLAAYLQPGLHRVGVDPTALKFASYYPEGAVLIPEFFSRSVLGMHGIDQKAKVITSLSMFYDLESPMQFMREVHELLADDGVWVFEQSYLPTMLEMNSYDTVCHEHLEYYALAQIKWMADRVGFTITDLEFNEINGGSFSVTVRKTGHGIESPDVARVLRAESSIGLGGVAPFEDFASRVEGLKAQLVEFLIRARAAGKSIAAIGASTKGNVLLQYCGLNHTTITAIGEVNPDKVGCLTPGTWIPIIPEREVLAQRPDYVLVLPWHFRKFFLESPQFAGTTLVFPLPSLEVRTACAN